ncbi:MAG: hypothetical protein GVY36_17425 [Verrucomicrobia bacterium]|jgi:hypothetical protein|nr:hypothetical protein [Verrucomicrobiota bacterium]
MDHHIPHIFKQTPLDYILAAIERLKATLNATTGSVIHCQEAKNFYTALGQDEMYIALFDWLSGQFQNFATDRGFFLLEDQNGDVQFGENTVHKIRTGLYTWLASLNASEQRQGLVERLQDSTCIQSQGPHMFLSKGRQAYRLRKLIDDLSKGAVWGKGIFHWLELFCYHRIPPNTITSQLLLALREINGLSDGMRSFAFLLTVMPDGTPSGTPVHNSRISIWPLFGDKPIDVSMKFCESLIRTRDNAQFRTVEVKSRRRRIRKIAVVDTEMDKHLEPYQTLESSLRAAVVSKDKPGLFFPLYFSNYFLGFVIVTMEKSLKALGLSQSSPAVMVEKLNEIIQTRAHDRVFQTLSKDILAYHRKEVINNCISSFEDIGYMLQDDTVRAALNTQLTRLPYLRPESSDKLLYGPPPPSGFRPIRIVTQSPDGKPKPGQIQLTRDNFGFFKNYYSTEIDAFIESIFSYGEGYEAILTLNDDVTIDKMPVASIESIELFREIQELLGAIQSILLAAISVKHTALRGGRREPAAFRDQRFDDRWSAVLWD